MSDIEKENFILFTKFYSPLSFPVLIKNSESTVVYKNFNDDSVALNFTCNLILNNICYQLFQLDKINNSVGRYETEFEEIAVLGKGGFGTVYQSKNKLDDQEYAIKKVYLNTTKNDKKIIREVKLFAKIASNKNVVRYYNAWIEELNRKDETKSVKKKIKKNAILYIQMQLCSCPDLRQWMEMRKEVCYQKNFEILKQILEGLNHIHEHSIIHRDLSPENIFVDYPVILLGDFGLAKSIADKVIVEDPETKEEVNVATAKNIIENIKKLDLEGEISQIYGTYNYCAPEILYEDKGVRNEVTTKSDIYSFGIICLELFLFFRTGMERIVTLNKIREKGIAAIKHIFEEKKLMKEYEFISLCLRVDPKERPTAAELLRSSQLKDLDDSCKEVFFVDFNSNSLEKKIEFLQESLQKLSPINRDILIRELSHSSTGESCNTGEDDDNYYNSDHTASKSKPINIPFSNRYKNAALSSSSLSEIETLSVSTPNGFKSYRNGESSILKDNLNSKAKMLKKSTSQDQLDIVSNITQEDCLFLSSELTDNEKLLQLETEKNSILFMKTHNLKSNYNQDAKNIIEQELEKKDKPLQKSKKKTKIRPLNELNKIFNDKSKKSSNFNFFNDNTGSYGSSSSNSSKNYIFSASDEDEVKSEKSKNDFSFDSVNSIDSLSKFGVFRLSTNFEDELEENADFEDYIKFED
ncbi:hypothetical protein HDU92_003815 [Lobulomyces angularis]|nr:hypothetical protein HDU92_003815 [Lobulomyces angularis]